MINPELYQINPSDSAQYEAQRFIRNDRDSRTPQEAVWACGQYLIAGYYLREDEAMIHAGYAFDQVSKQMQGGVACTH